MNISLAILFNQVGAGLGKYWLMRGENPRPQLRFSEEVNTMTQKERLVELLQCAPDKDGMPLKPPEPPEMEDDNK